MAKKGETIRNKKTGEQITWMETSEDTNGEALKMKFKVSPGGNVPVKHIHPNQNEHFEVISGTLKIECKNETSILSSGETKLIPQGTPHQWWNNSENDLVEFIVTMEPALNSDVFFEQLYGLANDDKTYEDGKPTFLQVMAMSNKYNIYIAGPPVGLQKAMSTLIGGIAHMLGYKSYYDKYNS